MEASPTPISPVTRHSRTCCRKSWRRGARRRIECAQRIFCGACLTRRSSGKHTPDLSPCHWDRGRGECWVVRSSIQHHTHPTLPLKGRAHPARRNAIRLRLELSANLAILVSSAVDVDVQV